MVKRYPHAAIISLESIPVYVNGKLVDGSVSTIEIKGRYDPDGKTVKLNELGKEIVINGVFYTKTPPPEVKAIGIKIDSLGIDSKIISWNKYQSHSTISI